MDKQTKINSVVMMNTVRFKFRHKKLLLVLLFLMVVLLIGTTISNLLSDEGMTRSNWISFGIFSLQMLFVVIIWQKSRANERYYVSWGDGRLSYFLPGQKTAEMYGFEEISSIQIDLKEIRFSVPAGQRKVNLDYYSFNERVTLKSAFQEISESLSPPSS